MTTDLAVPDALVTAAIEAILGTLTESEKRVLTLRFGLVDGHPQTLARAGETLGVTRERVRQIEVKALGKLRPKVVPEWCVSAPPRDMLVTAITATDSTVGDAGQIHGHKDSRR